MQALVETQIKPFYETERFSLFCGDCRSVLPTLETCSIDSIVCDPPYELGFMGKGWDRSGIAYDVEVWRECLRVLKPGGHLLAFGGSRTYHRLACAIEDAGFEIRDQVMWIYGQGFPKSKDVSKAIDSYLGVEPKVIGSRAAVPGVAFEQSTPYATGRTAINVTTGASWAAKHWNGYGTALKPAHEPAVLARKPIVGSVAENVLIHGTGALNIDGCRIAAPDGKPLFVNGVERDRNRSSYDTGGSNRTGEVTNEGRWPSNVCHDGSDEVLAAFPETSESRVSMRGTMGESPFSGIDGSGRSLLSNSLRGHNDSGGSAARFFYCAKASQEDRNEGLECATPARALFAEGTGLRNNGDGTPRNQTSTSRNVHPTVKPTELMRYLCRLITPPGGVVLDPFCGSGSTGKAAMLEGLKFVGIELSAEYCELAQRRIEAVTRQGSLFT